MCSLEETGCAYFQKFNHYINNEKPLLKSTFPLYIENCTFIVPIYFAISSAGST